jgi:hypothetical protein
VAVQTELPANGFGGGFMRQIMRRGASGGLAVLLLMALLSCGQDQRLVAITVTPDAFTFSNAAAGEIVQYTATGQFVHPPETRNITHQVAWSSPTPDVIFVDANGVGTVTGIACGTNIPVTATGSSDLRLPPAGNIVTGTVTVNVQLAGC